MLLNRWDNLSDEILRPRIGFRELLLRLRPDAGGVLEHACAAPSRLNSPVSPIPEPWNVGPGPGPIRCGGSTACPACSICCRKPPEAAFSRLHNGAFVLESLPAAAWCFAKHHDDPEATIVTGANGGYDADTVASMAGNLVGAPHGERALPGRWLSELEHREDLRELANRIRELAR